MIVCREILKGTGFPSALNKLSCRTLVLRGAPGTDCEAKASTQRWGPLQMPLEEELGFICALSVIPCTSSHRSLFDCLHLLRAVIPSYSVCIDPGKTSWIFHIFIHKTVIYIFLLDFL